MAVARSRIGHRYLLALIAAGTLIACSQGPETGLTYEEVVEGGVPVMVSRGDLDPDRVAFRIEEVLRLKQDPTDEESLLNAADAFMRGGDGNYYVVDRGDARIAVFGGDGEYLRSFGRKGAGPGEFDWMDLVAYTDDEITIWDSNQKRATRYGLDGAILESIPIPSGGLAAVFIPLGGSRYLTSHTPSEVRDGIAYRRYEVRIFDSVDSVPVVISTGESPTSMYYEESLPGGGIRTGQMSMPFTGWPGVLLTPDGRLLAAEGDTPELTWFDQSGSVLRKARLEIPPRPVTREMKDRYEESVTVSGGVSRRFGEQLYPERIGFSGTMLADESGFAWLAGVWGPGEVAEGSPPPWHVFDTRGRYLGVCRIPDRRTNIQDGFAMVVVRDPESGEETPTVYRIVPVIEGIRYP